MALRLGRLGRAGLWLIVAVTLVWASSAAAQIQLSMTGKWGSRKGVLVRVPLIGNVSCLSHMVGLGAGVTVGPVTPFPPPATLPFQVPAHAGGCVAASTTVASSMGVGGVPVNKTRTSNGAIGTAPASFTVPTGVFDLPAPPQRNVTPIPNLPQVQQFGSQATINGPFASPIDPLLGPASTQAQWRRFHRDAWMTQSGRPGVDFRACWFGTGAYVMGPCNSITEVNTAIGGEPLLVRYRGSGAGQNFGGTMGLLFDQSNGNNGTLALVNIPGLPTGAILIQSQAGVGSGPGGRGYRATQTANAAMSFVHLSYSLTPYTTIGGNTSASIIAGLGPIINQGTGEIAKLINFPLTVGSVLARNTGGTNGAGDPLTVTLSAKGFDARDQWGVGQIQLVAGGLIASAGNTPNIEIVSLNFVPEPGSTLLLAAGGLYLVGIARVRKRRR